MASKVKEALSKARQLAEIASDWHLDEVEIDGMMVSIYDLKDVFDDALHEFDTPNSAPMAEFGGDVDAPPTVPLPESVRVALRVALRFQRDNLEAYWSSMLVHGKRPSEIRDRIDAALEWLDEAQGKEGDDADR